MATIDANKFWQRVLKTPSCWLWQAGHKGGGYGGFAVGGQTERAHRVAWKIANGSIKKGLFVLHRCDNPICVNPSHLFLGTQAENMADMLVKGRHRFGSQGGPKCISEEIVSQVRKSSLSQRQAARAFGISKTHVRSIRLGLRRPFDRRETNCNGEVNVGNTPRPA